ncbi:MAG: hypothetical protein WBA53_01420 [Burkholderiaceae bacterium]
MRMVMLFVLVALAGCATTSGESEVAAGLHGSRCASIGSPANAPAERSWLQSIDPQVALSAYQLHCMRDTPLGL